MLTIRNNSRRNYLRVSSRFNEIHSRHVGTRTPDLYRVNFEVLNPKPFSSLAFPIFSRNKITKNGLVLVDELVTRFSACAETKSFRHKLENNSAAYFATPPTANVTDHFLARPGLIQCKSKCNNSAVDMATIVFSLFSFGFDELR